MNRSYCVLADTVIDNILYNNGLEDALKKEVTPEQSKRYWDEFHSGDPEHMRCVFELQTLIEDYIETHDIVDTVIEKMVNNTLLYVVKEYMIGDWSGFLMGVELAGISKMVLSDNGVATMYKFHKYAIKYAVNELLFEYIDREIWNYFWNHNTEDPYEVFMRLAGLNESEMEEK